MNRASKIILGLVVLGLVIWGAISITSAVRERDKQGTESRETEQAQKISVSLIVEAESEGVDKTYNLKVEKGSTVLEMMEEAKKEGFSFDYSESDLGILVSEIEGIRNDSQSGKFWLYYINGETAQKGVSDQKVQDNDQILWRFESSAF